MDIKTQLFNLYPEEIKAGCNATTIAPWVSFIEGRNCESGSSFIMTGIPKAKIFEVLPLEKIFI
jgi:hypothetical protein